MHEYSLVGALVAQAESTARQHGAVRVVRLHVRLGAGAGVEKRLFITAYETFRAGSVCEGAELVVVDEPMRWSCPRCGKEPAAGAALRCVDCQVPARLTSGDALILERVELERLDQPGTGDKTGDKTGDDIAQGEVSYVH